MEPMVEGRLIRLEENSYFLEERVKQLDQQLADQERRLASLAKSVKLMQEQLGDIAELLDNSRKSGPVDEIPPHHLPGRW